MKMLGFHLRTSKRLGSVLGSVSLPTQGFGCRAVTNNAYMYTYSKKYRNTFSTILTDTEDGSIDNRLHACVWCGYTCMNQVSRTCKWSNTIWAATVTLHQTAGALVERAYQSCRDYQIVQCETRRKALKRWFFLSVYKALHWALLGRHCVNVVPLLLCDALIGVTLLPSCKEHIWYIAAVVNSLCIIKGLLNSFIFVCSAQTFSHSVKEFTACYVYQRLVKHYRHCWCRRRVVNVSGALSCRFSQIKS